MPLRFHCDQWHNRGVRTTGEGCELIRSFEGCELTAYQDSGGTWTIGYGHTRGVCPGQVISQGMAEQWLLEDVAETEILVLNCVPVSLTDNQLSALVSFCFNVGLGYKDIKDGFKTLKSGEPSTMLKCLLARDFLRAAAEFPKWDRINGVPSAGLLRRRLAEQALFQAPEQEHGSD